jgi:hypothetical protein
MKKKTTEQFVAEAITVHQTEHREPIYDYSKVEYITTHKKVHITCPKLNHGMFEQTPSKHLCGQGCPKCGKTQNVKDRTKTQKQFISEAMCIHKNTNNEPIYDYSNVKYVNNNIKICIICPKLNHGKFEQTPANHLRNRGCPKCKCDKISIALRDTKEQFIQKSITIHQTENGEPLYDYSNVEYVNASEKVIIICPILNHGMFKQTPNSHISQKSGCPKCKCDKISIALRDTKEQFIQKSITIHQTENGEPLYDYSNVEYVNNHTKVNIICKYHSTFLQTPNHHLYGGRCPKCVISNYSKKAIYYLQFISTYYKINIKHAENGNEYIIYGKIKADGFCEKTNTIYEFHGDYWHGNPKRFNPNEMNNTTNMTFGELYQKTLEREQLIRDMGFNLIVMWESDWNKINNSIRTLQRLFRNSKHQ